VDNLDPTAFTPFALVVRRDPRLNTQTLVPLSLARVLAGAEDFPLQNEDQVYIFSRNEIHELAAAAAAAAIAANPTIPTSGQAQYDPAVAANLPGADANAFPGGTPPNIFGAAGSLAAAAQNGTAAQNFQQSLQSALLPNGTQVNPPYTILPAQNSESPAPAVAGRPTGAYTVVDPKSDPNAVLNPNAPLGTNMPVPFDRAAQTAQQQLANPTRATSATGLNTPPIMLRPEVEPNDVLTPLVLSPETRHVVRYAAQQLGVTTDVLVRMATDHLIWVLDQVKDPGPYLSAGTPTLDDMLQIAGGPLDRADLSSVEVTSTIVDPLAGISRTERVAYKGAPGDFRRVTLRPLDVVRLRPVFSDRDQGQVTVGGQVRFPGSFDITRAERLSSVLERAGGLTDESYAYGAIFTRRRAAISEREGNLREARELEAQAATPSALGVGQTEQDPSQRIQIVRTLAEQLRQAPVLGRITVTADPAILRVRPDLDVLLEPGDSVYIPKRPSTVTVSGEVLNSGTIQFESGLSVRDYIERAGGTTQGADSGRTFVVLPDGSARSVSESWLSFNNNVMVPPGSTIIVPRDLQPFSFGPFIRDATQIISQIAITAASLAVINK
jgi:protein involved in polysaccharide export with SLBB domain